MGSSQHLVTRIQCCQNIAADIVTCQKKTCHITPILMELHWLPVEFRIQYKVLLHVFRVLNSLSPGYLAGMLERHVPTHSLRSTDSMLLTVPRTRHRWGDCAFSRAGPVVWNDLPLAVCSASFLATFKMQLKTLLFTRVYDWLLSVPYIGPMIFCDCGKQTEIAELTVWNGIEQLTRKLYFLLNFLPNSWPKPLKKQRILKIFKDGTILVGYL